MNQLDRIESNSDELREQTPAALKKQWGQFFTPAAIADLMASFATVGLDEPRPLRILDPGAGHGILGLAASLAVLRRGEAVHLVSVEAEPEATAVLRRNLEQFGREHGSAFSSEVLDADFLTLAGSFAGAALAPFDVAVSNPPYFKLSPRDQRGGDAPNIYARFMEVAARLLAPNGRLCFIIPRSYASGHYFRRFRRRFHSEMALTRIHLFRSRRQAFKGDGVLQENLIINAIKQQPDPDAPVEISISEGVEDLLEPSVFKAKLARVVDVDTTESWLHLFESERDIVLAEAIEGLPATLSDLGFGISTGPVVPFRSRELLADTPEPGDVPLIWLQHVRAGGVVWPLQGGFRKPEYLRSSAPPKLRVPNEPCVLLRRFSAKEDRRRLTAAALHRGQLPGEFLGVENHVNVIRGVDGAMPELEAQGLAAVLNTEMFDAYFRVLNGNTQVSASEIRAIRLPSRDLLRQIGQSVEAGFVDAADRALEEVLGVAR